MKKSYLIFFVFVIILIIFITLFNIEIPSPSKIIKESYQIEIK